MADIEVLSPKWIFQCIQFLGLFSFSTIRFKRICYQLTCLCAIFTSYIFYYLGPLQEQEIEIFSITGIFGIMECSYES